MQFALNQTAKYFVPDFNLIFIKGFSFIARNVKGFWWKSAYNLEKKESTPTQNSQRLQVMNRGTPFIYVLNYNYLFLLHHNRHYF